jgi:hypothetical protein
LLLVKRTHRRKRLEELRAAAAVPRFGTVAPITRDTFMAQVTDPSTDVWVGGWQHFFTTLLLCKAKTRLS